MLFKDNGGGCSGLDSNQEEKSEIYIYPASLFDGQDNIHSRSVWTCVRTRPRWEKKFARWLSARRTAYFLPTFRCVRTTWRKKRVTIEPLFPGFVFVQGDFSKREFVDSACVVRLIKPRSEQEAGELDLQLADIWLAIASGQPLVPVKTFVEGQRVEVLDGPLRGTIGRVERTGRENRLILSVSMLGAGASVELSSDCRVELME